MLRSLRKVLLILLAVGAGAFFTLATATPAFAATAPMTCQHDATLSSLRACVQHATEQGHITDPMVAQTLLYFVDDAQMATDAGCNDGAIEDLHIFIAIVQNESGKTIVAMHANELIMHAHMVMQALGG